MTTKLEEMYRFVENDLTVWRYTSADVPQSYNGEDYSCVAIGRSQAENKNDFTHSSISVTVSLDNELGRKLLVDSSDTILTLTVFQRDEDEVSVQWKGRLTAVKPNDKSIELQFESIFTSLRRVGLRQRYQRPCPHVLYRGGCRLNKEDFATVSTAGAYTSNGLVLSVPDASSFPDGYFTGGMIEIDGVFRFIQSHSGWQITLMRPIAGFDTVKPCKIYPGCDRSKATCNSKFGNVLNFGGFPYFPLKNPFNLTSIV